MCTLRTLVHHCFMDLLFFLRFFRNKTTTLCVGLLGGYFMRSSMKIQMYSVLKLYKSHFKFVFNIFVHINYCLNFYILFFFVTRKSHFFDVLFWLLHIYEIWSIIVIKFLKLNFGFNDLRIIGKGRGFSFQFIFD